MVTEGIVLGHKISSRGIEVDKAKVEVIENYHHLPMLRQSEAFWGMQDSTEGL